MRISFLLFLISSFLLHACSGEKMGSKFNYDRADLFAKSQLDTSLMCIDYLPNQRFEISCINSFSQNGLLNVRAYCKKEGYTKPRNGSCGNNLLWIFEYENEANAKAAIDEFIEQMNASSEGYFGSKSGNYLVQYGPVIYSLEESCAGGDYLERERQFLAAITDAGDDCTILNADCGGLDYRIESKGSLSH